MDPLPALDVILKGGGILGALLILSLFGIVFLYKKCTGVQEDKDKCQAARIDDGKQVIQETVRAITQSSSHISVNATALENMNTTNASRVVTLEKLVDRVETLTKAIDELRDEVLRRGN